MEIYPPKQVNLLTEVNLPKVKNHWSKRTLKTVEIGIPWWTSN